MRAVCRPASSILSAIISSISSPLATNMSSVPGRKISSAATRPNTRSANDETTSPSLTAVSAVMDCSVPQSFMRTMQSCATSTKRRVRYPEFAVFNAVSDKPLRAPWVELKYSSTVKPSLKFEMIGVSIISPFGLAIRPRIPPNCFIWVTDPRAPEWAII